MLLPNEAKETVWEKHTRLGDVALQEERYKDAYEAYMAALSEARGFERNDKRLFSSLDCLARLQMKQQKYPDAISLFRELLALRETASVPDKLEIAVTLECLAHAHRNQHEHAKSEELLLQALALREAELSPEHPDILMSLDPLLTLYCFYIENRDAVDTEAMIKRTIYLKEKALGPGHPEVTARMVSLSTVYSEKKEHEKAEAVCQDVIVRQQNEFGNISVEVAESLIKLADVYATQGKYAEHVYQQVLSIAASMSPLQEAAILVQLAEHYRFNNSREKATPLLTRALALMESALGFKHPNLVETLRGLSDLCTYRKDFVKASRYLERVAEIHEMQFGPEHPEFATSLSCLSDMYDACYQFVDSEPLKERVLAISEKIYGHNNLQVLPALTGVAQVKERLKKWTRRRISSGAVKLLAAFF